MIVRKRYTVLGSISIALAIALSGCGGDVNAKNQVGTLSSQKITAPSLTGFSTAVPTTVDAGDAVGYVGSAYASEKSRAAYGKVTYLLNGKDADKFFVDKDGFIRVKQPLKNGMTYSVELTGTNQVGTSQPIGVNITCGSIITDKNGIRSTRCLDNQSCPVDNLPWLPEHPEGEKLVAELPGDATLFGIKDNGLDGDKFEIVTVNGKAYLAFKEVPDFENPTDEANWKSGAKDNDYKVTVLFYSDTGRQEVCREHDMCVRVINQEEPCPTIFNTIHIKENSTYVTNVTSSAGTPFVINDGADMSVFEFVGDMLKFKDTAIPDFENPGSADGDNDYWVNLFDGGQGKQQLKIVIDNVPDTPPVITGFSASLPEGTPANTKLSSINSAYKIDVSAQGEDAIQFIVLKDQSNSTVVGLDYYVDINGEIYTNKELPAGTTIMQATAYNESGWGTPTEIVVDVAEVQDKGPRIHPLFANIDENTAGGTEVGEVRILDLGDFASVSDFEQLILKDYDYPSDTTSPNTSPFKLAINGSGKLVLKLKDTYNADKLDYEKVKFYTLKMQLKDDDTGVTSNETCIYVQINDIDENDPIFVSDEPVQKIMPENQALIGTFKAFDETNPVTYVIAGGADADKFKIEPVTDSQGVLNSFKLSFDDTKFPASVVLNTGIHLPDYENPVDSDFDNVYVVSITGTDSVPLPEGAHSKTVEYQVHIQNVFEVLPTLANPGPLQMAYSGESTIIAVENLSDMDGAVAGFELGRQWKDGTELFGSDKKFAINPNSGRLYVSGGVPGDEGTYQVEVRAKNEAGNWGEYETFTVIVTAP